MDPVGVVNTVAGMVSTVGRVAGVALYSIRGLSGFVPIVYARCLSSLIFFKLYIHASLLAAKSA